MSIEDNNDEYDNSDEDEDWCLLAAVVDDEIEDNRKMPALPVLPAGDKKSKSESATNKKQKKSATTMKAPNTSKQAKVWQSNS